MLLYERKTPFILTISHRCVRKAMKAARGDALGTAVDDFAV